MKTDRSVIVTGAGGGMGSLFVRRFLENGDTVFAGDVDAAALDRLRADLGHSALLHTAVADVSDEASCGSLAALARATLRAGGFAGQLRRPLPGSRPSPS